MDRTQDGRSRGKAYVGDMWRLYQIVRGLAPLEADPSQRSDAKIVALFNGYGAACRLLLTARRAQQDAGGGKHSFRTFDRLRLTRSRASHLGQHQDLLKQLALEPGGADGDNRRRVGSLAGLSQKRRRFDTENDHIAVRRTHHEIEQSRWVDKGDFDSDLHQRTEFGLEFIVRIDHQ